MTRNTSTMNKKGFSLIEAILVVTVMSIILGAASPNIIKGILAKYGTKTAMDITTIQEASRAYIIDTKAWPTTISDLTAAGKYLPATWNGNNPFNQPYVLSSTPFLLTISTIVQEGAQKVVANNLPASTVLGTTVTSSIGTPAGAAGVPVGSIIPWSGSQVPSGWFLCNGQAISRTTYADLFSAVGTTYGGGDSSSTFNLPDLRGRTVVGLDNMGGVNAGVITGGWGSTLGGKYGEEAHQLTIAEMPTHSHNGWGNPAYGAYDGHSSPLVTHVYSGVPTSTTGGDRPHNIVQPSMALGYIIKAQ